MTRDDAPRFSPEQAQALADFNDAVELMGRAVEVLHGRGARDELDAILRKFLRGAGDLVSGQSGQE